MVFMFLPSFTVLLSTYIYCCETNPDNINVVSAYYAHLFLLGKISIHLYILVVSSVVSGFLFARFPTVECIPTI